jgi:hypothetical protein
MIHGGHEDYPPGAGRGKQNGPATPSQVTMIHGGHEDYPRGAGRGKQNGPATPSQVATQHSEG